MYQPLPRFRPARHDSFGGNLDRSVIAGLVQAGTRANGKRTMTATFATHLYLATRPAAPSAK